MFFNVCLFWLYLFFFGKYMVIFSVWLWGIILILYIGLWLGIICFMIVCLVLWYDVFNFFFFDMIMFLCFVFIRILFLVFLNFVIFMICLLVCVVNRVVLFIRLVKFVLEKLGVLWVMVLGLILLLIGILCICIFRICLWFRIFGVEIIIWWLKWFGCSSVEFSIFGWLVVVMIIILLFGLKLFILISNWFRVCFCLLWLSFKFVLCECLIVLILLIKMM